ncbi:unnamed protein product [Allacma fusca]|uniref:Protein PTHB1 n=1 Tax=Allacma fusca TaxID=39272 RepID=A0A8J2LG05_9HEXA|nr:unnamed protein product [Allacma fusca]
MSLFTIKELWSLDCNEASLSFTTNSVAVANIDNESEEIAKVVVGSFTGFLRIIGPPAGMEEASDNRFTFPAEPLVGNMLAESQLGSPVLQVDTGKFVSGSDNIHLAVLHPNKFGVYAVLRLPGQVEHGSQYKITLLYEHKLKRLAFNMCSGPFGKGVTSTADLSLQSKERHFICVQSLDGTLSFFEHEVFTFSRYLPGFLLPGPLAYVPPWDSFLTVTSSWNLQCFKYSSLVMSKDDANVQTQETAVGKKLNPEWSYSIGEEPIGSLQVLYNPRNHSEVKVVVGTLRHLFCFGGGGDLLWCKRLDNQIDSFHSFLSGENCSMTLAASGNEAGAIYVYNGTTLKWAAKLPFVPVHLSRIHLRELEGGIVFLSGTGRVFVGYLGTEPSLFIAPPIQARELDYEAAEIELTQLRKIVAESGDQNVVASKDATVEVKVEFEGQKSKWIESNGMEVMSLIATIKILCHARVNDVRVNICTPKPIVCSHESVMIGDIVGRHNYQTEFYLESEAIPSDLTCEVYVFYLNDTGVPHFVQKCGIKVPLFIIAKPHDQLEREADAKLTFAVNKPVMNLASLYNDFDWNGDTNSIGLTFCLYSGDKVTLLASTKSSSSSASRYRVQSNSMAAMHIIFRDFLDRMNRKFNREKSELKITLVGVDNDVPLLNEYFSEIDAHILRRRREVQIKEDLSGRAAQLRAIQRRLLIRFRDKNPVPLTQLEILLDGSLDHINDTLNLMEENEIEKQKSECRLSGATRLMLELIQIQGGRDSSKLKKSIKSTLDKIRKASHPPVVIPEPKSQAELKPEKLIGNEIIERMASARSRTARKRTPVLAPIPEPAEGEMEHVTSAGETIQNASLNPIPEAQEDPMSEVLPPPEPLAEESEQTPIDVPPNLEETPIESSILEQMHEDGSQEDNFCDGALLKQRKKLYLKNIRLDAPFAQMSAFVEGVPSSAVDIY